MNILWIIILYSDVIISVAFSGTIQKIDTLNSQPAIKGTSIRLACYILQFTDQDLVFIYKSDSSVLTGSLPATSVTKCLPSFCFTTSSGRYTYSADSGHLYIYIENLNRSEDQKWWTCSLGSQRKDVYLTIYTVPQTLQLVSPPDQNQDLAENAVTLTCSTGCTYPQPSLKWYYTELGGLRQEWPTPGSDTQTTEGCTDSEKIYTSTLSLARYSTFTGNLNKNVTFTCGIPSFSGMTQPLYTNSSVNIRFTVPATTPTITNQTAGILVMMENDSVSMECISSSTWPVAIVTWRKGTQLLTNVQNINSTTSDGLMRVRSIVTFTPRRIDNNETIYCETAIPGQQTKPVSQQRITVYYTTVQSFYTAEHTGQDNVTVDEHDAQIEFKCIVDSNIASTTKIMFEGAILKEGKNVTSLSFTRQDISCNDAGAYTCEGTNDYGGTSNKTMFLFVRCVPRPKGQIQRNLTSELLSPITLSFTAIAYPEPGSKGFAWHKEETVGWVPLLSNDHLKISSSELQSNLTVLNVSKEDYGNYRVTVTNTIGHYVQHLFLSEQTSAHQTECQCKSPNSDQTALAVGISLGVVCCVLASVATYLAISRMRTVTKEAKSLSKTKKQSAYASTSFTSDVVERQEYENPATDQGEAFSQPQYTDLRRYANTDKDTYDVIKKV